MKIGNISPIVGAPFTYHRIKFIHTFLVLSIIVVVGVAVVADVVELNGEGGCVNDAGELGWSARRLAATATTDVVLNNFKIFRLMGKQVVRGVKGAFRVNKNLLRHLLIDGNRKG